MKEPTRAPDSTLLQRKGQGTNQGWGNNMHLLCNFMFRPPRDRRNTPWPKTTELQRMRRHRIANKAHIFNSVL